MNSAIREIRFLNSKIADRVLYLLNVSSCEKIFSDTMINYLRLVKITKNTQKFTLLLEKIETHLLKKSMYNLVIHNIPEYGVLSETNTVEKIGYAHINDTFEPYGKIDTFDMVRGTVYIRFHDKDVPLLLHNKINKMMMGNQILQTMVV